MTVKTEQGDTQAQDLETDASKDEAPPEGSGEDTPKHEGEAATPQEGEGSDELVVMIGDTPPEEEASPVIRGIRHELRERDNRIKELERKLEDARPKQTDEVGPEPTLKECDYDEAEFRARLVEWTERKRETDERAKAKAKADEEARAAWQAKANAYDGAKAALKVKDFADAEATVFATLSKTQQGILIHGAETPAVLVYALGTNAAKLKELAALADPVQFAFAAAKLEGQLKVTPKKAPPPPESRPKGGAPVTGAVDSALERLREEAARTGDFTKVRQYQREKRAAG